MDLPPNVKYVQRGKKEKKKQIRKSQVLLEVLLILLILEFVLLLLVKLRVLGPHTTHPMHTQMTTHVTLHRELTSTSFLAALEGTLARV